MGTRDRSFETKPRLVPVANIVALVLLGVAITAVSLAFVTSLDAVLLGLTIPRILRFPLIGMRVAQNLCFLKAIPACIRKVNSKAYRLEICMWPLMKYMLVTVAVSITMI